MPILVILVLFILYTAMKGSANKPNIKVATFVKATYGAYAVEYGNYWKIPAARLLAHIAVESRGIMNLPTGAAGEEGIMQITPVALADVIANTSLQYTMQDLKEHDWASIEVGAAFLYLLEQRTGSLDLASRKYNGSLTNSVTATYLANVKGYEQLIKTI